MAKLLITLLRRFGLLLQQLLPSVQTVFFIMALEGFLQLQGVEPTILEAAHLLHAAEL